MAYGNGGEYGNQIAKPTMQDPRVLGGGNAPMPTTNGPNVHALLSEQEHAIEQLHNAITELEQRLSCVLAPTPPMNSGPVQASTESGLVLDRLGRYAQAISHATGRISMLLNRLQV